MSGRRRMSGWSALLLCGLAACADDGDALLGRAQRADVAPADPPGEPPVPEASEPPAVSPPTWPVPTSLTEIAEVGRCNVPLSGHLAIDLHYAGLKPLGCEGECWRPDGPEVQRSVSARHVVPLADGSAWITGERATLHGSLGRSDAIVLVHLAADGSVLGSAVVDNRWAGVAHSARNAFAVDDDGVAWVLSTDLDNEAPRLRRFDAAAVELAPPAAPAGIPRAIAALPGEGVLVQSLTLLSPPAWTPSTASISLFAADGTIAWTREVGAGAFEGALVGGPAGFAWFNESPRELSYKAIDVATYDGAGVPGWRKDSRVHVASGGFRNYFEFGYDGDANLVLAMTPPSPIGGNRIDQPGIVDLESFDASGNARWALRLSSSLSIGFAVAPSGDVWVGEREIWTLEKPTMGGVIARLSQDGATCRRYTYPELRGLDELATAPDGRLWFVSGASVGRFAEPTP